MPWGPATNATRLRPGADLLDARLASAVPRRGLVDRVTPVLRAAKLEHGAHRVWVKRDDLSCELYGGGKARKLDYALAHPRFANRKRILAIGAEGSHQLVALCIFGQRLGLEVEALCFPQVHSEHVANNFAITRTLAKRVWPAASRPGLALAWARARVAGWARRQGEPRAEYLSPGASTPRGCLGHVAAGLEFAAQVRAGVCPAPDRVFVPAGTAGTVAGLAVGFALGELPTTVHAVSSVERWAFHRLALWAKVRAVLRELQALGLRALGPGSVDALTRLQARGVHVVLDHGAVGPGYGVPTPASRAAVVAAKREGLCLEATYTGKCVASMLRWQHVDAGAKELLFWNTHASQDPGLALPRSETQFVAATSLAGEEHAP